MLCKPLLSFMEELCKGFLKVILQYKNEVPQLQKWAWQTQIAATKQKPQK